MSEEPRWPKPRRARPVGPLRARRWGVRRRPPKPAVPFEFAKPTREAKTKHGRRPRELGYMLFCRERGCELASDRELQRVLEIVHVCEGGVEFAHLSDKKRYDVGDVGAGLCGDGSHKGIDGRIGGKARWYVKLDRLGQRMVRDRLSARPRADWEALTPAQRDEFDRRAKAQLAARYPRRGG